MYYYSKKSSSKIIHQQNCRHVARLDEGRTGQFQTIEYAQYLGYCMCKCCAPIIGYLKKEEEEMQQYCLKNGLAYFLSDGCIEVITPESKWKIITNGTKNRMFLYHGNTFEKDTKSMVHGYHSQAVRRDTILQYL